MVTHHSSGKISAVLVALVGLLGACQPGGRVADDSTSWRFRPLPETAAVPCGPEDAAEGRAAIVVALPGRVRPARAPLPDTEAERHAFAACYEPLVRVACTGRLEPALATRWEVSDGGRQWIFHLRSDARFWTGEPVEAATVLSAWRRAEALCRLRGEPDPFLAFDPSGQAVEALDARTLSVTLRSADDQFPLQLVHPALAVVGPSDGRGWLAGSGPCRPDGPPGTEQIVLVPHGGHPDAPRWERLTLRILTSSDEPRDALALGSHALLTRSRQVLDYFRGQPGQRLLELPWDRWYYLVTPAGDPRWADGWDQLALADEVGDAISAPASFLAYEPPPSDRPLPTPSVAVLDPPDLPFSPDRPSLDVDLVIWPDDDPEAGQLADRLVIVATRPLRDTQTNPNRGPLEPPRVGSQAARPGALAVPASTLVGHLQRARTGAVIMPWPRRFARVDDDLARLLSLATWLQDAARDQGVDPLTAPPGTRPARFTDPARYAESQAAVNRLERGNKVQPLVRSRAAVVSKPAVRGWSWSLDGTLRLWTLTRQD